MPDTVKLTISREAMDELMVIRDSGVTNMMDRPNVAYLARKWELFALKEWLGCHTIGDYATLIFGGVEVVGE